MLDTKYGLKYSMPHSVVHIVDNSMRTPGIQPIIVDDPSLYATIVVTGAPMGVDNEIISVNRSDVLNVSYGLDNISTSDIAKYGQSVTYPASILSQGVPIKLMRVTPEDSTYAFSCLLIQWRWDATETKLHVRFKTTSGNYNNGLPVGVSHASFKNPARLNAALVRGFKIDNQDDKDGTGTWKQRVFMTAIASGRGKTYNYYNYAINQTQQSRRPANVKYLFSTIDTRTSLPVEKFFGSLVNQNNGNRVDYVETVNVQVNQRVKGSSVLIPTINESAVTELYNDYMERLQYCIDSNIASSDDDMKFIKNVYATMTINIFDPIYGRYIYNGDTDVKLPFMQVDMFDLDITKLEEANRITVILDEDQSSTEYAENPTVLYDMLTSKNTYGVSNASDTYHVGDVFMNDTVNPKLTMITTINQYTGSVTSIPITSINVSANVENEEEAIEETFKAAITYSGTPTVANIKTLVDDLIKRNKLVPRKTGTADDDTYMIDPIVVIDSSTNVQTFTIALISYKEDSNGKVVYDDNSDGPSKILTNAEIYKRLVYPSSSITSFATRSGDTNWLTPGATIIDVKNDSAVYVNGYDFDGSSTGTKIPVNSNRQFIVGICPTTVSITKDIMNNSYDLLMYYSNSSDLKVEWKIKSVSVPAGDENQSKNYKVGDEFTVTELPRSRFKVTATDSTNGKVLAVDVISSAEENKVTVNTEYSASETVGEDKPSGLKIIIKEVEPNVISTTDPVMIQRYVVNGTTGSIYRVGMYPTEIPSNYYSSSYGINPNSELGGIPVENGYAGFFDDDISEIEYKWKYSELLVKAFRGEIDPRIMSTARVPAKYLFDGGFNTIIGQTILPYMTYKPVDIINASTIYTEDEKEAITLDNSIISNIVEYADIDVKQAMYDLMEYRCYQGIPDEMRPVGPGSGLSLHLDSGVTDASTALAINQSFIKRFSNPNASWDIGGYVSATDGLSYTYTKRIVDNIFAHMKRYNVNKPFTGKYTNIAPTEYVSFFPDVDATDWEMRELLYKSGGNAWTMDINGNLQRKSQRTLYREGDTSDIIQENNMRTLSQLTYLLQNKIDSYLLEYDDDGVLKTLKDECDNMFTNWVGNYVQALDIQFQRDTNPDDGGEIVVCYCRVTFRGLILRVPIIVDVQRRTNAEA